MRCVVLCGAGRAFAAGADVAGLRALSAEDVLAGERGARWQRLRAARRAGDRRGARLVPRRRLRARPDLRHRASRPRARASGCPETGLGLIPGAGDATAAARRGPLARARGDPRRPHAVGARGAAARHLLARRRARGARARGARAGRAHRRPRPRWPYASLARRCRPAYEQPLEAGLGEERRLFALAFASADAREGMDAFVARRAPSWSHDDDRRTDATASSATARSRPSTLDRPDALNAQTRASRRALVQDLRALSADDAVRCVVLTGAGRAFCAGQDLREEGALDDVDDDDPRDLHPDRRGDLGHAEAGRSPRSTAPPPARGSRSRSPATCATWPRTPCS